MTTTEALTATLTALIELAQETLRLEVDAERSSQHDAVFLAHVRTAGPALAAATLVLLAEVETWRGGGGVVLAAIKDIVAYRPTAQPDKHRDQCERVVPCAATAEAEAASLRTALAAQGGVIDKQRRMLTAADDRIAALTLRAEHMDAERAAEAKNAATWLQSAYDVEEQCKQLRTELAELTSRCKCGGAVQQPPKVRDLLNAPEFRAGTHTIRFCDHDFRSELRRGTYPRSYGQRGPDKYHVEARRQVGLTPGKWHSWAPSFDELDTLATLVEIPHDER